jgi:dephospho-CoA kinase
LFLGKPIIGIVGGIGSGKSCVANLFGELGCLVIHSDDLVHAAYSEPAVLGTVRRWWGEGVLSAEGTRVDRRAIGRIVFSDPLERARLEALLHPIVGAIRRQRMSAAAPGVLAVVWDSPLLFETGLNRQCDAVVFVEADEPVRLARVASRGWDAVELDRREKSQWPLDKKRAFADYVLNNAADEAQQTRDHVSQLLSRILSNNPKDTTAETPVDGRQAGDNPQSRDR